MGGGGSSGPEYAEEIRIMSNDKAKENFINQAEPIKLNKYINFFIILLIFLLIIFIYNKRND